MVVGVDYSAIPRFKITIDSDSDQLLGKRLKKFFNLVKHQNFGEMGEVSDCAIFSKFQFLEFFLVF